MDKLLDLLKEVRSKIGDRSYVAMILGVVVLTMGNELCPQSLPHCVAIVRIVAGFLFLLGLCEALGRVYVPVLIMPASKGFGDGLTCGFFAGLIGGALGYGAHTAADGWTEGPAYRVLLVVAFTLPIGGFMGACCSLVKPDAQIDWRKYAGVLFGGMVVVFGGLALITTTAIPEVQNRGILLRDVQLVFEIFLVFIALLSAFSAKWKLSDTVAALTACVLLIGIGRLATHFVSVNPSEYGVNRLGEIEFFLPDGFWNLLLTLLVGFVGVLAAYGIAMREPLWSARLFRKSRAESAGG